MQTLEVSYKSKLSLIILLRSIVLVDSVGEVSKSAVTVVMVSGGGVVLESIVH